MEKHLHIICHTVPYPADFGGVIDLFYKIKNLAALDVKIHLHCFDYGRGEQPELNKYCVEVHYYQRKSFFRGWSPTLPYIVNSRNNPLLLKRLNQDNYPVLMEGIHSTYFLHKNLLHGRKVYVRLANVEFSYYHNQARAQHSVFKKLYLQMESALLKKYERSICNKAHFLTVSKHDLEVYQNLGATNISYLPVFVAWDAVSIEEVKTSFCLYHGDLSIAENLKAVYGLLKIFNDIHVPFVIAGKNPPKRLLNEAETNENICIIANPTNEEMNDLIAKAQINVLPSYNNTGVKLKFIHALFNGKFCVVNESTVADTGLESLCYVCRNDEEFKSTILLLIHKEITQSEIEKRKEILSVTYNNKANALKLIQEIY